MNENHEPDLRSCSECGRVYDLAAQDYFGPECPGCEGEDKEPTCSGKAGDCSRDVENPGDYCWQHEDE
jgi:hypothetical protein